MNQTDTGYLLNKVTPTLDLKDLKVGNDYLLPGDKSSLITRTLMEIKGEECRIVAAHHAQQQVGTYHTYIVHYSWLRNLSHKPKLNL